MAREGFFKGAVVLLLLFLAAVSSGCGVTFERKWQQPPACSEPGDQLTGHWEGTWESEFNGHKGKLRAIIVKCNDGHYRAHYHATFLGVIPFAYETVHTASPQQGGSTQFTGEEDLGYFAGGVYHYNGWSDGTSFVACYQADKDHGVFRMQRVTPCGCETCNGPSWMAETVTPASDPMR